MTDPRIEAAARALYEANVGLIWPRDADDETMEDSYEDARIALAAAAAVIASAPLGTIPIPEIRDGRPIPGEDEANGCGVISPRQAHPEYEGSSGLPRNVRNYLPRVRCAQSTRHQDHVTAGELRCGRTERVH